MPFFLLVNLTILFSFSAKGTSNVCSSEEATFKSNPLCLVLYFESIICFSSLSSPHVTLYKNKRLGCFVS